MTTLAPPPTLDMAPEVFDPAAEAFVSSLPVFEAAMEALAADVAADAAQAQAAMGAAAASANFVGAWSSLTGALAIPASASHGGNVWVLVASVADVTAHEPGVSASWVLSYPQRRMPIFDTATAGLTPWSANELVHNARVTLPLAATTLVSNGTSFVAAAATGSSVAQSLDGRTWTLRTLPSSGVWSIMPVAGGYMAAKQGSSGATASAYSVDDGVTWTGFDAGLTWEGSALIAKSAGTPGGKAVAYGASPYVATAAGASWGAPQTSPGAVTALFVTTGGNVVARTATATYYTSATGLTGSWTTRSLPGSSDTVVQDADGALLAYVAGSLTATVYRSTDGITWTDLALQLVHTTSTIRSIAGVRLCTPASGSNTGWTRHGDIWVPRTVFAALDASPRLTAKVGDIHVSINSGTTTAFVFDATAADAAMSTWE